MLSDVNNKLQDDINMQAEEVKILKLKVEELGYLSNKHLFNFVLFSNFILHSSYIQAEKEAYDKRVRELEKILMEIKDKSLHDNGMQVSGILGERDEFEKMEKELNLAYHKIEQLNIKLVEARSEIESLSAQITLSDERERLLKTLQAKAALFEKVILEKQTKPEYLTVGTNTDNLSDTSELLAAQYEAEMIQKEIAIRTTIKKEFDDKFQKMQENFLQYKTKEVENCNKCNNYQLNIQQYEVLLKKNKDELKNSKQQRQEDREAIAKLLDVWKEKFYSLEVQNQELNNKYLKAKKYCDDLIKQIKKREEEEKKLIEMIKKEAEVFRL